MIVLATIGMIVLLCVGALSLVATFQMTVFSLGFTGKIGPEVVIPFLISVVCFSLAFWLNPFSISVGVAA